MLVFAHFPVSCASCISPSSFCLDTVPCFPIFKVPALLVFFFIIQELPATKCWGSHPHGDKRWHPPPPSFSCCVLFVPISCVTSAFVMVCIYALLMACTRTPPTFGNSNKLREVRDACTLSILYIRENTDNCNMCTSLLCCALYTLHTTSMKIYILVYMCTFHSEMGKV